MPQHLAFPFRLATDGRLAALDQDSPEEIGQSVALLLATQPGERRSIPGYGMAAPVGTGLDPAAAADAIEEWENRADAAAVDIDFAGFTDEHAVVIPATPAQAATTTDEEA